jgi:hypothetical protein
MNYKVSIRQKTTGHSEQLMCAQSENRMCNSGYYRIYMSLNVNLYY